MGKRLERFGEVRIIDETNGFGLDFVEKTESRFWSINLLVSSILINACAVQMGAGPPSNMVSSPSHAADLRLFLTKRKPSSIKI